MTDNTMVLQINPNNVTVTTAQIVLVGSPVSAVRVVRGYSDVQGAPFLKDRIATTAEYGDIFAEVGDALERMTNQARDLRSRFDRAFAKIDELAP